MGDNCQNYDQIELQTKFKDEELGTKLCIEGSRITELSPLPREHGSSLSVKNLFFNIPARRKFLKADRTEMRYILEEFFY